MAALQHPEAEEGLYLDNFYHLHEEDQRPKVNATQEQILETLTQLIQEGVVSYDDSGKEVVFFLSSSSSVVSN